MNSKIILSSVFAIILFAGMASAQHIKAFSGAQSAILAPVQSSALPVLTVAAGKPIGIQLIPRVGDEKNLYVLVGTRAYYSATAIPCSGRSATTRPTVITGVGNDTITASSGRDVLVGGTGSDRLAGARTAGENYFIIKMKPVYVTSYQTGGSAGTCQLLKVRLANGELLGAEIRSF